MTRTTAKTRASARARPSFRVSLRLGLGLLLVLGLELGGGPSIILRQMIFLGSLLGIELQLVLGLVP